MVGISSGWDCQSRLAPASFKSLMAGSWGHLGEQALDSMHLDADVAGGESGDLADLSGVEVVQVKQHHLPIQRLQTTDQFVQQREPLLIVDRAVGVMRGGWLGDLFQVLQL